MKNRFNLFECECNWNCGIMKINWDLTMSQCMFPVEMGYFTN